MITTFRSALFCVLMCFTLAAQAALQWSDVGLAGFSGPNTFKPTMKLGTGGVPYVIFNDGTQNGKATVMKYAGGAWVVVGNAGFSTGRFNNPDININAAGDIYVCYSDNTLSGKITVKKFDGTNWATIGSAGFSSTIIEDCKLTFDASGNPFVAFKEVDFNAENIDVMRYNGSAWIAVGTTNFPCNNTSNVSLVIDAGGNPVVAYSARGTSAYTHKVTVQKYDGAIWTMLGGGPVSVGGSYSPSLAINSAGVLHIAYTDGFPNFFANVKQFNGTNWVSVGNADFSAGSVYYMTMAIDGNDVPYVAYSDEPNNYGVTVKKLDGATWATVGQENISDITGSFSSLGFDAANTPYVAYQLGEEANREMAVKRYTTVPDYQVGTITGGPFCPGSTVNIPFTITNGTFNSTNIFTAQISDASGSFANRNYIGTLAGNASGIISATLPYDADGTGYRIRIISSTPNAVSLENGVDLTVQGMHNGTKTYIGGVDGWENPANWLPCGTPNTTDDVIIDGAVTVEIPEYYTVEAKSVSLTNGANLTFRQGASMDMNGTLQNSVGGQIILEQGCYMNVGSTGAIVINGSLENNGYISNNGRISGAGTIIANGYIANQSGAHIAPGNSPGKLSVTGDFDLGEAILDIELNGNVPETQYDVLSVSGEAMVGNATLNLIQDPGFTLINPNLITFLQASTVSGTFTTNLAANTAISYNSPAAGQVSLNAIVPLPITLTNFSASKTATSNLLFWATAAETFNNRFEIQRSADGEHFATLGQVMAKGRATTYQWDDRAPLAGLNYYRLQLFTENGNTTYSGIVAVKANAPGVSTAIRVSPNPATQLIHLSNNNPALEGGTAIIYGMDGQEKHRFLLRADHIIEVAAWPAGIYVLHLPNGENLKITKQ